MGFGYENAYGYYILDDQGNPSEGQIIWSDVNENIGQTFSMEGLNPDKVGFFLVPNGENLNTNLKDGQKVTFEKDENGNWDPVVGNENVEGILGVTLFSDSSLNKDGYQYAKDNSTNGNQNWEELIGGGDKDHNDANMQVSWSTPVIEDPIADEAAKPENGEDTLLGGDGDPGLLAGGTGVDEAKGGSGDDVIPVPTTQDMPLGGSGDDVLPEVKAKIVF